MVDDSGMSIDSLGLATLGVPHNVHRYSALILSDNLLLWRFRAIFARLIVL